MHIEVHALVNESDAKAIEKLNKHLSGGNFTECESRHILIGDEVLRIFWIYLDEPDPEDLTDTLENAIPNIEGVTYKCYMKKPDHTYMTYIKSKLQGLKSVSSSYNESHNADKYEEDHENYSNMYNIITSILNITTAHE